MENHTFTMHHLQPHYPEGFKTPKCSLCFLASCKTQCLEASQLVLGTEVKSGSLQKEPGRPYRAQYMFSTNLSQYASLTVWA